MDMSLFHHLSFYLNIIYFQDKDSGDFTAFYSQFPEAIAQGRTKEEAKELLAEIFPLMMQDKHDDFYKEIYANKAGNVSFEQQKVTA